MFDYSVDHHDARARHERRIARGLAAFAAREGADRRPVRAYCPLSLLAGWVVARHRPRGNAHAAV